MAPVRILSDDDIRTVLDVQSLLPVVEKAFIKQGRGAVERPDRPHYPVGIDIGEESTGPAGTALTMPAYVHGESTFATKLATVHEGNAEQGLPTVNAQVVLTDAGTGQPLAFMAGNRITNARTGCIGGLAARDLALEPATLGLVGAGTQARWQARAIAAATDLREILVYSPSESRATCAAELGAELGVETSAVDTPTEAVRRATVVVTATTATDPVFPGAALDSGTLVVGVGSYTADTQELDTQVFERADQVYADVPEEVIEVGDLRATDLRVGDLTPLSEVFETRAGRRDDDERIVVKSVGSATLDAAAAAHVYERAVDRDVGTAVAV